MLRNLDITPKLLGAKGLLLCLLLGLFGCDQAEEQAGYCLREGQRLSLPQATCEQVGGIVMAEDSVDQPILQEPKPKAAPRGDVAVRFMSIKELALPEGQASE